MSKVKDENRKDKFNWSGKEIKVNLSQCSNCYNNQSVQSCKAYKNKPEVYAMNQRVCPYKIDE